MNNVIIEVKHISKEYKLYENKSDRLKEAISLTGKQYYKPFFALNDVSFSVQRGETIGIIGTNGSGKSTLLKILTGVVNPSSGCVEINGRVSALLELGAGFNPEYTGLENIALHGTMMGYTKEEMIARKARIIDFADIGEYINQPVKNYSSGMFARLAFAVAINVEPEILIVDETLSVGDMRFQIKCMNRMKEMMECGTTILFVSHDINSIRRFCSKAIWLNKGLMVSTGEVNDVADQYEDFLRCSELKEDEGIQQERHSDVHIPPFTMSTDGSIARIVDVALIDTTGTNIERISYEDRLCVRVTYDVYDTSVIAPVLGVAIYSVNDDYICGLNTLLDKVEIPWAYGRNEFSVIYQNGLRVLGGGYYFDAALMDQTASVNLDYKKRVKDITVYSAYVAEGRLVLPHYWRQLI